MGRHFDSAALLARRGQFQAFAEWEWHNPDHVSPERALEITGELCGIFPPPTEIEAEFESKCAGIARMRDALARIRPVARG